jgi:protein-S-isoprenylcysteine O-methyltransferase Ste14
VHTRATQGKQDNGIQEVVSFHFKKEGRMNIKQSSKMGFLFFIACVLSVLAFPFNPLVIFKVVEPNNVEALWYVGWIFWAAGVALIILPYYYLYYRRVKVLVDSGIYAVVRHPLYLGWILSIFVATIFLHQHWLFVITGFSGIASVYLISREEDRFNIEKFGKNYKNYMEKVPRMNLLLGVMRRLWRKFPTADFMEHKHEECANFENGRCKFYHITVNPNGSACPHFKDKKKKAEAQTNDIAEEN